jgi:3-methylcrotonyl-CoA carboxylase alpha subunit
VFKTLLIVNRGEIACRVIETARRLSIRTVAVYSDADQSARHVRLADQAVRLGPAAAADSYLRSDLILKVAKETGAEAIHPGYGFLSENAEFAQACADLGIAFVGPSAHAIKEMGLKDRAKAIAVSAGAPVLPGYWDADQSEATLLHEAKRIGFPLLVKAVAGGGGRGIRAVERLEDLAAALASAKREAAASFGDDRVMLEKLVMRPRHIEVQVFGDTHGNLVHLFERDCSIQRRRQKLIEEAPAPGMSQDVRDVLTASALKIARAVNYSNAGTVEFVADGDGPLRPDGFWFLEMNTRLQVEHPVTEAITGLDLVEWQLRVASGERLPLEQDAISLNGWAVEARIVAEDPAKGFLPSSGVLAGLQADRETSRKVRYDGGYEIGDVIPDAYDSLLGKAIAHGADRTGALSALSQYLESSVLTGVATNTGYLARLCQLPRFADGAVHTGLIEEEADALAKPSAVSARLIGLAAICVQVGRELSVPQNSSPFATVDGWRMNSTTALSVLFHLEGQTCQVNLRSDAVQLSAGFGGDHAVLARDLIHAHQTESGWTFLIGQGSSEGEENDIAATVFVDEDGAILVERGEVWTYPFLRPDIAADTLEASDDVKAPLPGKIALVQPGLDVGMAVRKGDVLVVLEAMKMEHALTAPRDGVIADLQAIEGRQVRAGDLLVRLVEEDPA